MSSASIGRGAAPATLSFQSTLGSLPLPLDLYGPSSPSVVWPASDSAAKAIVTWAEEISFENAVLTTSASCAPQPLSASAVNASASRRVMPIAPCRRTAVSDGYPTSGPDLTHQL